MTRKTALKSLNFVLSAVVALAVLGAFVSANRGHPVRAVMLAALAAVLLVPARVKAYYWSDLLAGLHFLSQEDYARSKARTESFLEDLRKRPWLRHLVWLGSSRYSMSAEVLALNNLGAAEVQLGHLDMARAHFARAIELDPECPLPYRNMFTLLMRKASFAEAKPWLEKAAALGWKGGTEDRRAQASALRNATFSTTGNAPVAQPTALTTEPPVIGAYIVSLLNDDVTPLELVISGLEKVFGMTGAQAFATALRVQRAGEAACAGFTDESTAQRKADELRSFVQAGGHELTCTVKPRPTS